MVLYYGLLALQTANNTVATTTATSERANLSQKQKAVSNSMGKISSSSNSWIYTEDLRKRFEERYADCRYIFVPVYVNGKSSRHNHSTLAIIPQKTDGDNAWMYSRSLRDHFYYSTSKISLSSTANISSSVCCVTNRAFLREELPIKENTKTKFFKRSSSSKDNSTSSLSSFTTRTNYLTKYRANDVVEEEDDEGIENENHSVPLIKQNAMVPSRTTTDPSNENITVVSTMTNNDLAITKSNVQHVTTHRNKLTRLRSFFFKLSSPSSSSSGT